MKIIEHLKNHGNVELLEDNHLILTYDESKIVLRYNIGDMFSSIKGVNSVKVQILNSKDIDDNKFIDSLKKVIEVEKINNYPCGKEYETQQELKKILKKLDYFDANILKLQKDHVVVDFNNFTIRIHDKYNIFPKLKQEALTITDMNEMEGMIDEMKVLYQEITESVQ